MLDARWTVETHDVPGMSDDARRRGFRTVRTTVLMLAAPDGSTFRFDPAPEPHRLEPQMAELTDFLRPLGYAPFLARDEAMRYAHDGTRGVDLRVTVRNLDGRCARYEVFGCPERGADVRLFPWHERRTLYLVREGRVLLSCGEPGSFENDRELWWVQNGVAERRWSKPPVAAGA